MKWCSLLIFITICEVRKSKLKLQKRGEMNNINVYTVLPSLPIPIVLKIFFSTNFSSSQYASIFSPFFPFFLYFPLLLFSSLFTSSLEKPSSWPWNHSPGEYGTLFTPGHSKRTLSIIFFTFHSYNNVWIMRMYKNIENESFVCLPVPGINIHDIIYTLDMDNEHKIHMYISMGYSDK